MSKYEDYIIKVLKKENIIFEREKQYKDLRNGLYRFDFYIPQTNSLIEIQGEQHFQFNKKFHKKREDFLKAQERDRRKIAYAQAKQISLYIIPYWEIEKIGQSKDIFKNEYIAKDRFFNDVIWREYQKNG